MAPLRILPDVTGSRIFKMAAAKPEELISQLLDNIHDSNAFPTTNPPFSGSRMSTAPLRILLDVIDVFKCDFYFWFGRLYVNFRCRSTSRVKETNNIGFLVPENVA